MMKPAVLRNLTMASAKHLLSSGHITPQHHAKIMKKVGVPGAPKPPALGAMSPGPKMMPRAGSPMGAPVDAGSAPPPAMMGALDAVQGRGAAPMTPLDE